MDFKTRFSGKMQKISKEGAIDHMVLQSDKPINPLKKVTIRNLHDQEQDQNLNQSSRLVYAYPHETRNNDNQTKNDDQGRQNHYMQALPRISNLGNLDSNPDRQKDDLNSESKQHTVYSHQKTSFYSNMQQARGNPSEQRQPEQEIGMQSDNFANLAFQGSTAQNSISMRMFQQKMSQQTKPDGLYQANPFPGLSHTAEQSPQK